MFDALTAETRAFFDRLTRDPGVIGVHPSDLFCSDSRCTFMTDDGRVLYFDDHHLSLQGADYVMPSFAPVFAPADN